MNWLEGFCDLGQARMSQVYSCICGQPVAEWSRMVLLHEASHSPGGFPEHIFIVEAMLSQTVERQNTFQASDCIELAPVPLAKETWGQAWSQHQRAPQKEGMGQGGVKFGIIKSIYYWQLLWYFFHRIYIAKIVVSFQGLKHPFLWIPVP